jgi:hypothetical protein
MKIEIANGGECAWHSRLWLFQVGTYGPVNVAVWNNSLERALEELGGHLVDRGYFGLIVPHDSQEAAEMYDEAKDELGPDATDEEVQEHAEVDMTYTESGWIRSDEWYVNEIDLADPRYREILLKSVEEMYDLSGSDAAALIRRVCS